MVHWKRMDAQKLFTEPSAIFSVSEFLDFINALVGARSVVVHGEITGARPHPTGMYFSLKDASGAATPSVMDCYMSPFAYRGLGFAIEDGMEVKVGGAASIYKAKGRFSFRVETLELAGEGALKKAYDLLKIKLESEGVFARKRPLPDFIQSIGVITSRTGAVIDDFRKNLLPVGLHISLYDTRVEGEQAVPGIMRGIAYFNEKRPDLDLLVIIRGGGSLEDLQAFNNEHVVRAIFGSKIPTVCGIGHDRDVPLACLAADMMTSTPTAVATTVVNPTWTRLREQVPNLTRSIFQDFKNALDAASMRASHAAARSFAGIEKVIAVFRRTEQAFFHHLATLGLSIQEQIRSLDRIAAFLDASSPERNLKLGYSIVRSGSGAIIRSAKNVTRGESVTTRLADGEFTAEVSDVTFNS